MTVACLSMCFLWPCSNYRCFSTWYLCITSLRSPAKAVGIDISVEPQARRRLPTGPGNGRHYVRILYSRHLHIM